MNANGRVYDFGRFKTQKLINKQKIMDKQNFNKTFKKINRQLEEQRKLIEEQNSNR